MPTIAFNLIKVSVSNSACDLSSTHKFHLGTYYL